MSGWAAAAKVGGDILSGMFSAKSQRSINRTQIQLAREANTFNAAEAVKSRKFNAEEALKGREFAFNTNLWAQSRNELETKRNRDFQKTMSNTAVSRKIGRAHV